MSVSPQHHAISPPTPAPSPQPELHGLLPSLAAANNNNNNNDNNNPSSSSNPRGNRAVPIGPSPLSTTSTIANNINTPSMDAISQLLSSLPLGHSSEKDLAVLLALLGRVYPSLNHPRLRHSFLSSLVSLCPLSDLTQLNSLITPRLKLDFFTKLPDEVSLLVLSFIDDPKTLARAMQVSSRWRTLVEDEGTWKGMCEKHRFEMEEEEEEEDQDDDDEEGEEEEVVDEDQSSMDASWNPEQSVGESSSNPEGMPSVSSTSIPSTSIQIPNTSTSTSSSIITNSSIIPTKTSHNPQTSTDLIYSIQSRFKSKGLDPSQASKDLKWFHSRLRNQSEAQTDKPRNTRELIEEEEKIEKSNLIELILREECEERFGGLREQEIESQNRIQKDDDDDSMDLDSDFNSKTTKRNDPSISKHQYLGLGKPSSLIVNQIKSGNFNGSNTPIPSSSSSSLTTKRTFSYRTHFKLAYLTESSWLRGGRLLTQHTSSDNGAVVTSLALDSEWIVVGMANSKIHVFDAKTGLFARTLQGHESGVWCLCLVSKTTEGLGNQNQESMKSKPRFEKSSNSSSSSSLRNKLERKRNKNQDSNLNLDRVGGGNRNELENDLKLIHHDKRKNATSFSSSPSSSNPNNPIHGSYSNFSKKLSEKRNNQSSSTSRFQENQIGIQKSPVLSHPIPSYPINSKGSKLAEELIEKINVEDEKLKTESKRNGKEKEKEKDEKMSDPFEINSENSKSFNQGIGKSIDGSEMVDDENILIWFNKSKDLLIQKEKESNSSFNQSRKSSSPSSSSSRKGQERGIETALAELEAGSIRDSIMKNGGEIPNELKNLTQTSSDQNGKEKGKGKASKESKSKSTSKSKSKFVSEQQPPLADKKTRTTTSFSNFGPFNAGIEGELGVGGETHFVNQDGNENENPDIQMNQNPTTNGLEEGEEGIQDVDQEGFNPNSMEDEDHHDYDEEEDEDDEDEEDEEELEFLKRPYSPSDYALAWGEEEGIDEDDVYDKRNRNGNGEDFFGNGNGGNDQEDIEMKNSDSSNISNPSFENKYQRRFNNDYPGKKGRKTSNYQNGGGVNANTNSSGRSKNKEDNSHVLTGSSKGFGNKHALVISGACDRTVRVWDLRTGKCKHILKGHTSTVRCLKVLDGRPLAISGSRDSTLRVWDLKRGKLIHLLSGHQNSVRCIEVSGTRVVSGSYDCTARIWNVLDGNCLNILRGHFHQIYAVAFDGKIVATGSLDSTVRVYDANHGKCLAVLQGHTSLVGQLQLTNSILITGGSDGRVIIFCLKTFQCLHRLCAHDNSVTCLQFDDKFIVTGGNDGKVKLWNFKTGAFIREICEPSEQVWKVSYRDDKCVILCKREGKTSMDVITFRPPVEES